MQNQPLVSIITPMFNSETYIGQTIESVIKQHYSNWELIIVDDGSSDSSWEIVYAKSLEDNRIKPFRRNRLPKGVSTSRNIGIENSKGEYIIFLDSDDLLYPHCLSERATYLMAHPQLDFAVFQMEMFLPSGEIKKEYTTLDAYNYLYSFFTYKHPWVVTCPLWKAEFFKERLKGFDESFSILEDPELHTRALLLHNVRYKVLHQSQYVDCAYRVDYKPANIKGELLAVFSYAKLFFERIKDREDEKECKALFVQYYETVLAHYSGQTNETIYDNISSMKKINHLFYNEKIISKKMFQKTQYFLVLHQYKLFNNKLVSWLLKKLGFTNFYYYVII